MSDDKDRSNETVVQFPPPSEKYGGTPEDALKWALAQLQSGELTASRVLIIFDEDNRTDEKGEVIRGVMHIRHEGEGSLPQFLWMTRMADEYLMDIWRRYDG